MLFGVKEKPDVFDAHELYLEGKYEKALNLCEQILAANPSSYSCLNMIANIYFISGQSDKGAQYIYKLRDYFAKIGEYEKAIAAIERLISINPSKIEYLTNLSDLYLEYGNENRYIKNIADIADVYKRGGDIATCEKIYHDAVPNLKKSKNVFFIINRLTAIKSMSVIGDIASEFIFDNSMFSYDQQDDVFLLCAESVCPQEKYISHLPSFISRGEGRLGLVEDAVYKYFLNNKNDELYQELNTLCDLTSLTERLMEEAPDNLPETMESIAEEPVDTIIAEPEEPGQLPESQTEEVPVEATLEDEPIQLPEPEEPSDTESILEIVTDKVESDAEVIPEHLDIDTHVNNVEEAPVESLELDSYDTAGELHVAPEIDGLDTFDQEDTAIEVQQVSGLETYEFDQPEETPAQEPSAAPQAIETPVPDADQALDAFDKGEAVYPDEDGLSLFDEITAEDTPDDIFAGFGKDVTESSSDDPFSAFNDQDGSEPVVEEAQPEQAPDEIDMKQAMFEEPEAAEEKQEKHVEQIDMSDIEIAEREQKDIFDEEDDVEDAEPEEEVRQIDMSDIAIEKREEDDMFADLEQLSKKEEKAEVQQIDLSDVDMTKSDDDMFADLVSEKKEEQKKETKQIDMSDVTSAGKGSDIFDQEV